jgi:hypothetical protein
VPSLTGSGNGAPPAQAAGLPVAFLPEPGRDFDAPGRQRLVFPGGDQRAPHFGNREGPQDRAGVGLQGAGSRLMRRQRSPGAREHRPSRWLQPHTSPGLGSCSNLAGVGAYYRRRREAPQDNEMVSGPIVPAAFVAGAQILATTDRLICAP